jgi:dienelactone hydrolase
MIRPALASIALSFACSAVALPPAERVRFDSLDRAGDGAVRIEALFYKPEGTMPEGGWPAVIALHGCGGIYSEIQSRRDEPNARHAKRAEALLASGYAVVFPDSFRSRGIEQICTSRADQRAVTAARRRLDALGALAWLGSRSDVAKDRIALLGWSHGGSTVLATINAGDGVVASATERIPIRAAVAFYPGCTPSAQSEQWRTSTPTRILIGAADDWTPAKPCEALDARAKERNWPLQTTIYEGAYHGFDAPGGRVRLRDDVPGGVNPGRGVHVGPDPKAREDADRRVDAFLAERLRR